MDDKVNEILHRLPPKPPRSRLDLHAALIEEMRRRGRTYREIAHVLEEAFQLRTSPSNIYYFVRLRAREARKAKAEQVKRPEAGKVNALMAPTRRTASHGSQSAAEVAERIAALRNRKPIEQRPTGFEYNPDEPFRIITPRKQEPDK